MKEVSPEAMSDSLTERGLLLGTVGSMSPEQASGRKVDARSDLFSFGVLLYEMFTGYSPFRRARWLDSLEAVKTEPHVPARSLRPELPTELSNLIDRLLEKNPAHRPQSTQQLVDVLAGIAAATGIGELPAPDVRWAEDPGRPAETDSFHEVLAPGGTATEPPSWSRRLGPSLVSLAFLALAAIGLIAGKALFLKEPIPVLVLEPELRTLEQAED